MANGRGDFGPDDFYRLAREARRRLRDSRRWLGVAVGSIVGLTMLVSSYYQVEPDEVGLVTRFGRFVRTSGPGPHGKIPFGIERV